MRSCGEVVVPRARFMEEDEEEAAAVTAVTVVAPCKHGAAFRLLACDLAGRLKKPGLIAAPPSSLRTACSCSCCLTEDGCGAARGLAVGEGLSACIHTAPRASFSDSWFFTSAAVVPAILVCDNKPAAITTAVIVDKLQGSQDSIRRPPTVPELVVRGEQLFGSESLEG